MIKNYTFLDTIKCHGQTGDEKVIFIGPNHGLKKTQIRHGQQLDLGIVAIARPVHNMPACLKVTTYLKRKSSVCQYLQTCEKAFNAGVMRELLLCTLAYTAGACNHLDSVGKITIVYGQWL